MEIYQGPVDDAGEPRSVDRCFVDLPGDPGLRWNPAWRDVSTTEGQWTARAKAEDP